MINASIVARLRRRLFPVAAMCLTTLSVFLPLAAQQSITGSSKAASASKKSITKRPDIDRFRARVNAALSEAHAQKAFWGILVVDRLFRVVKSKLYTMRWCALLAQKTQEHLARWRRALERSSADPADVKLVEELEAKISP